MKRLSLIISVLCLAAPQSMAQIENLEGPGYVELDLETEILYARSAGPASVSADATIWILNKGKYEIKVAGLNQNNCLVMRSYPRSLEPICYNEAASETMLPIEILRFEMRNNGESWDEINRVVDEKIESGELIAPTSPALAYMMSSVQDLYAPNGYHAGPWKPHLMFYLSELTGEDMGVYDATHPDFQMSKSGTYLAEFIVVVPEFVAPE